MPPKRTASRPSARSGGGRGTASAISEAEAQDLVGRLARLTASVVYDALRGLGADNPILPARIRCLTGPVPFAGRIFTVAGRERLGVAREEGLIAWATLLSRIPGDHVVVCQPRTHDIALMGELSARALKLKGVRGYVVDGACRDMDLVERIGLPVYGMHATPADISGRWLPDPGTGRIRIGSCVVQDEDFLIADRDGVVVIPAALARDTVTEAEVMIRSESAMRKAILSGMDPLLAYLKHRKF